MKVSEIYKILNEIAPFDTQEGWDNSGLIVGSNESEFERIYLSLDVDSTLLDIVRPNSLIIAHHPLIFKGLKTVDFSTYPGLILRKMIMKNVSLIAMHTNADLAFLNEYFVSEVLGLKVYKKDGFLIYSNLKISFDELTNLLKSKLNLVNLRAIYAKDEIRSVAICTGSGGDLVSEVRADAFITGDIKYHQALQAKENKLNLFDVGHFESECYFGASLAKYLQNLKIEVIISNSKNPFMHY
ncbi:Nif3-like dinuclear metal center hexameric protein [Campylobacter sp. faydin G-105]|uniref:Nif3-like dinuclear metal center hexameric protein n=1 Tax=Campylobacter anatolicus TaxID=2829105 RepID=UPI001BA08974|nr:Nif3-like dinuclear metal center hexameric protein [Campylobacter anatolicus]MBR8462086.1 Nif3-like dinuclear metal center hexameric protein [Campylobacter anatolicus]